MVVGAAVLMAVLLAGSDPAGGPDPDRAAQSLVEAERAFARRVDADGVRAGFLAYLARDAIVFRPGPVPARDWYEGRPDPPMSLSWEPVWAEVSASGDLGYTTGPWTSRGKAGGKPPSHGHYVSIWRRGSDGEWRVALDTGVGHPQAIQPPKRPVLRAAGRAVTGDTARFDLLAADRALAGAAATQGWAGALGGRAATDIWMLRDGRAPVLGSRDAVQAAAAEGTLTWQPESGEIADSGDLGYAYGSYRRGDENGTYLRIWRREPGGWRVALDLLQPAPRP